jgi:hypothetical protein
MLIVFSLKITSDEAVQLWGFFESINSAFAGVGNLRLNATVRQEQDDVWEQRALYFWCFRGVLGAGGSIETQKTFVVDADDFHVSVEDYFCQLYAICTLVDRPRQLRFVFRQLADSDVKVQYGRYCHLPMTLLRADQRPRQVMWCTKES